MVSVLFVCLGNICRSPMAEAVFRHKVKQAGLADKMTVDSAGIGSWHVGEEPHEGTKKLLAKNGLSVEGMKGRQIDRRDLERFDYILAMDTDNLQALAKLQKEAGQTGFVGKLTDFVHSTEVDDVPDPYFTGDFDSVYELVNEACRHLLEFIRERESL